MIPSSLYLFISFSNLITDNRNQYLNEDISVQVRDEYSFLLSIIIPTSSNFFQLLCIPTLVPPLLVTQSRSTYTIHDSLICLIHCVSYRCPSSLYHINIQYQYPISILRYYDRCYAIIGQKTNWK